MPPLSIKVKNLYKVFESHGKRVEVLKGIDLNIKKGEMLSIVGASGAGKSTLLHIIGTIESPTTGSVFYEDEDLFSMNDKRLAQFRNNKIGFIFQFHHLLPEFSAIENTMMPALIRGVRKREAYNGAEDMLNKVGLRHRISHKPGELSGGEQQRVAIARALMLKPEVILADEPTGNLDTKTGNAIHELLIDLNAELEIILVMVTHNRILAEKIPRKISLMDGRIVSDVVS
ncbi:MAG: ABC transporter ATP-binding protein [Thermodesulfobacteriota bacterium]|nr:ABC transporter ATP-binding protein [Thermodesulfobacteriota bacterium]